MSKLKGSLAVAGFWIGILSALVVIFVIPEVVISILGLLFVCWLLFMLVTAAYSISRDIYEEYK